VNCGERVAKKVLRESVLTVLKVRSGSGDLSCQVVIAPFERKVAQFRPLLFREKLLFLFGDGQYPPPAEQGQCSFEKAVSTEDEVTGMLCRLERLGNQDDLGELAFERVPLENGIWLEARGPAPSARQHPKHAFRTNE